MLEANLVPDCKLLVVTFTEPFSPADLLSAAKIDPTAESGPRQYICVLTDFSAVDVSDISAAMSRQFALARAAKINPRHGDPIAIVVRSEDDFGIFRMHNQWVEATGLRAEQDAFVTTDYREALCWLGERTGQPDLESVVMRTAPRRAQSDGGANSGLV
jgi:hypothetical protein